jgi:twitching motility protein PilT
MMPQVAVRATAASLVDTTRGGVNGPAWPGQPPADGKISPLSITEPRDATRGGVNGPALPDPGGPESPPLITEPSEVPPALAALVAEARRRNATDLHVAANRPVLVRTLGELVALDPAPRPAAEIEALVLPLLGPTRRQQLAERGYVDLAVDVPGGGRLRANISRQQGGLKGAFRLAVAVPPSLIELGLPAAVAKVTEHHQGLIVIAGPSGHGKTTTLAALVDLLNRARPIHILTIEEPVEIVHPRYAAVVSQREVGRHTLSFAAALKASLREDPDVIVIGELRDRETVEIALTAAETGHLVLATMSTPSAAKTIDRLVDMFPPDDQSQVRASLGGALRAIVAQRLLPDAHGTGMVAVVELLVGVLALANLIRDNKLFQLPNLMQRGRAFGMLRLDDSLLELVRAGKLAEDVALRHADNKKELAAALHPPPPPAEPARRSLFGRKDRE